MLRLDVDLPRPFVPPDNPYVGDPAVLDEIWAFGLRNPWRYSFDRLTGDLYIGDVGEGSWEEISFQPAASHGTENYGWPCWEGRLCRPSSDCTCGLPHGPDYEPPIHSYENGADGCAIIGGFVYRGSAIPSLQGSYLFGDFCTSRIWSLRYADGQAVDLVERTQELEPAGFLTIDRITSFGEDAAGELYVVDPEGGEIYKIVPACTATKYCAAIPNSTNFPAEIGHAGSSSVASNDLVLQATHCPRNRLGLFFYGPTQIDVPFGNGRLCVGAGGIGLFRLDPPLLVSDLGEAVRPLDYGTPPMDSGPGEVLPGATWNFQFWFRDPFAGGHAFNTSDALSVLFCP
jgi:hypothetical protein